MKYQLVLQLPAHSTDDFDKLVALEDQLIDSLGKKHDVDGHDFGSGAMNIFIITNQPMKAFEISKPVFQRKRLLGKLTAACRKMKGEDYTVVWPVDYSGKFELMSSDSNGLSPAELIKALKKGVKSLQSEANPDAEIIEGYHSVIKVLEKNLRKQKNPSPRKKDRKTSARRPHSNS